MEDEQIAKVKKALRHWADTHPHPNGVVLQSAGWEYTPKQIAWEVEHETEFGQLQLRVIEHALDEHKVKLEEMLKGFYKDRGIAAAFGEDDPRDNPFGEAKPRGKPMRRAG